MAGLFLAQFPGDAVRGAVAAGRVHRLAPGSATDPAVLRGRARFLLGAAAVGGASTAAAWRTGGVRAVLLPHVLTDACGVRRADIGAKSKPGGRDEGL